MEKSRSKKILKLRWLVKREAVFYISIPFLPEVMAKVIQRALPLPTHKEKHIDHQMQHVSRSLWSYKTESYKTITVQINTRCEWLTSLTFSGSLSRAAPMPPWNRMNVVKQVWQLEVTLRFAVHALHWLILRFKENSNRSPKQGRQLIDHKIYKCLR